MTDAEKIEFTAGRVHALVGFVTAAVMTHPDPARLAAAWEKVSLANLATAEGAPVPDSYVDGVHDMQERIQKSLDLVLKRPTSRE